jgi:hypothetical protein
VSRLQVLELCDSGGGDKGMLVLGLIPAGDADGSGYSRRLDAKHKNRERSGTAFHSRIDGYAWARGTRLSRPTIREIEMKSLGNGERRFVVASETQQFHRPQVHHMLP